MKWLRAIVIMGRAGAVPFLGLLGAVLAIPLLAGPVGAQQALAQGGGELPVTAVRQIEELLAAKAQRTPAQRKVSSQLLDAAESAQPPERGGIAQRLDRERVAQQPPGPVVEVRQQAADLDADAEPEQVTVDIQADVTPAVLARIRALGGILVNTVPKYRTIRARLPLAALEPLAAMEAVQFIRPADQPIIQRALERSALARTVAASSKVNTSEGDVAHQANMARQTYSVDGTGIGIGVISDGVETLADQQATGDVPGQVLVLPGQEGGSFQLACGRRSSGTEGTAMLEIVHDLAPGADLFFADGGGGSAQMAQNIENLCAAGADIIVDDIGYLGASAFQDDVIAQAISTAAANGCYYFSSAGNGGNLNDGTAGVWEGDFAAGSALDLNGVSPGAVFHDFGSGVTGNRITRGNTLPIILHWADPVGESANDYDLFLIDSDNNVLASSTSTQDGTQDPIEYIGGSCNDDREDARLVIVKNTGALDRYVRLNYVRGELEIATAGQTYGHSASQDAIGVAAVDVRSAGGQAGVFDGTESVETFSSDGPRRIFFEANGTPITPGNFSSTGGRVLQKPDLAAADAVSTSTPGFSTFRGTSAAAPHAAAIGALVLEAAGGPANVTADALRTAMTGSALDIEAMDADRDSGAGIVMAPDAVDAVDVPVADRNGAPTVVSTPAVRTLAAGGAAVTIDVAGALSDPDDDTLTYTALSSDPGSLEISLTGSMLTLTPRSPGSVVVAVRATDPSGLSVTTAVSVTVVPLVLSDVTLRLSSSSIGENGGVSTVTARLDRASAADTTLLVGATAVDPATSNDFMLSANKTLTITAGQTSSAGTVTIIANNNDVDAPNKTVTVSAAVDNADGVTGPSPVTLTIRDDDAAPAVTLNLSPGSIGENRGVSTVTASLDRASGADTTVTVSAMAVAPADSDDFMLSANKTLTIAAGRTDSTGTVAITANNNNVDAPNKEVRVSATADNSHSVAGNPSPATLTITDDDDGPELTLAVGPSAIAEAGGVSTVTVESNNGVAFAQDQRLDLVFAGTAAKGADYTVALERLTLAAGQTSVDTTVTAVDDGIDDDAETVLVTARHGGGVLGAEQTITIDDDDDAPVIQTASPILVDENETAVATLEATDADRPAEDLTWRIAGGADRSRFRLTSDGELTFRAAPDYENPNDSDGNGDYEVTAEVSDGSNPVEAVFTVRLQDVDDTAPELSSATVNGATLTLTYGEALDGGSTPAAGDYTVSGGNSARTVSNVLVSGQAVTLTLDPAVEHGETRIRVSYRPGTNPIQDAADNGAVRLSNAPVTNNTGDTTSPTVSRVQITSRPQRNATYAEGEEIEVTVTFSETVVVTGTPRLGLNVGGVDRTANYRAGTGAALRFAYAVADGENDGDGVSIEANSLTGTIRDGANNNSLLTHDGLAADAGHKVDGVKPALAVTSGAVVNGATLTLTYDEALDGSSRPLTAAFTVNVDGAERGVSRVAVGGSAVTLTLQPEVGVGQGVRITYRVPGANPVQDAVGNDARPLTSLTVENNTLDTTAPRVSGAAIASYPGPDGTYAEEDVIEVTVTFSETVQVDTTNGTPTLALRVGRQTRPATYDRGSNSDRLAFSYMVADGDLDADGISIAAGRIALNGGTIGDLADNPAILAYEAVPPQPGHAVDGIRPVLRGATVSGDTLTLTYGEALDEDSTPAGGDFTVDVAGTERPVVGVQVSGRAVELTLDTPVTPGQTVTVSYTTGTRPLQDATGNAADDLTEYTVGSSGPVTPPGPGPGPGPPAPPRPTTNTDPVITTPGPFDVAENQTRVVRIEALDSDPGDAIRSYAIAGGADGALFSIVAHTGVLSFREPPNFEAPADVGSTDPPSEAGDNEYIVVVRVASGPLARDRTVEQAFAVRVTDADRESPEAPEAPRVTLALEASLTVEWTEPENPGPPITGYDVQYREGPSGFFINAPHEGTGQTATLTGLKAATLYQVQVRASNEEGTGRWSQPGEGLTLAGPTALLPFSVPDRGGISFTSQGTSAELRVGYGQVETDGGMTPPAGLAIFGSRVNGILASEAGVPASAPVREGRIFAETAGPVRTGLALANPNDTAATIAFFFTNTEGIDFGHGTFTLGPREQIARFLDEGPFNGGSAIEGTFTFTADLPVAVIALRGFVNERSEFLMTTLPVAPLAVPTTATVYFPHFAAGGGWTTQVILVNPTHAPISGNVQFLGPGSETEAAAPATLTLADGRSGSTFSYAIPPRSATRLRTSNPAGPLEVGSVRAVPDAGQTAPAGVSIFSFQKDGTTVSETGVPASTAGAAFRVYVEASGTPDPPGVVVRSGIALTNTSDTPTTVQLELTDLDGTATGSTRSLTLPASGHVARFIDEFFPTLTTPFSGILRITSNAPDIAIVGLRLAISQRNEILVTTTPPVDENAAAITAGLFFPHFVDSDGWTTQFILFSGSPGQTAAGMIRFTGQDGQPLELSVAPTVPPMIP